MGKDTKTLVFGFGILGGGLATTNWLLKHGAKVTITDLKTKKDLLPTLKKVQGKVVLKLGGHTKKDIENSELVVMNPDVSIANEYIRHAFEKNIPVKNEATLFFKHCACPIVGITGTRGKTTTTYWINHLLGAKYKSHIVGNSTKFQFLKVLDTTSRLDWVVAEVPSFHLELFSPEMRKPDIAIITNLYQDHLNRHLTMQGYADVKANIFVGQKQGQCLVLNADNGWSTYFKKIAKEKSKGFVWFFSAKGKLPKSRNGVFYKHGAVWYQFDSHANKVLDLKNFEKEYGAHNVENLLAASLASYLVGVSGQDIAKRIKSLPQVPFRQEIIYRGKLSSRRSSTLIIVNDTTATSPDGAIAAVKRFGGPNTILIAGGTDRNLDFKEWGKIIPEHIRPENLILLQGTATAKMLASLPKTGGWHGERIVVETLAAALERALAAGGGCSGSALVLFSPGAKSFEKFKNEYDRGKKFNALVRRRVSHVPKN